MLGGCCIGVAYSTLFRPPHLACEQQPGQNILVHVAACRQRGIQHASALLPVNMMLPPNCVTDQHHDAEQSWLHNTRQHHTCCNLRMSFSGGQPHVYADIHTSHTTSLPPSKGQNCRPSLEKGSAPEIPCLHLTSWLCKERSQYECQHHFAPMQSSRRHGRPACAFVASTIQQPVRSCKQARLQTAAIQQQTPTSAGHPLLHTPSITRSNMSNRPKSPFMACP